jgi:hypothetical protein
MLIYLIPRSQPLTNCMRMGERYLEPNYMFISQFQSNLMALEVICYYSAGTWEPGRPDSGDFPPSVLGNPVIGWPDEKWLDIRQIDILGPIMTNRTILAKSKQCDGMEPDNVDGYSNPTGFPLTYQDQINCLFVFLFVHSNKFPTNTHQITVLLRI